MSDRVLVSLPRRPSGSRCEQGICDSARPTAQDIVTHLSGSDPQTVRDAWEVGIGIAGKLAGPWSKPDLWGRQYRQRLDGAFAVWAWAGGSDRHASGAPVYATTEEADADLRAQGYRLVEEAPDEDA